MGEGRPHVPVLLDPRRRRDARVRGDATPTVFVVARDGTLVGKALGTKPWTSPAGRALLEAAAGPVSRRVGTSSGARTHDVLILGAGGAGLCAALHAADASPTLRSASWSRGCSAAPAARGWCRAATTRCSRRRIRSRRTCSTRSRAAAGSTTRSWCGRSCARRPAACSSWSRATAASSIARREGRIHQKPFAGQTHDRTIHKGDLTGIEIMNRLAEQVRRARTSPCWRNAARSSCVLDDAGRAAGALVLDMRRGALHVVAGARDAARDGRRARRCTGSSRARPTRPSDGIALAYRARACRCGTWRWSSSIRPASSSPAR